jgi:hypothetical protein
LCEKPLYLYHLRGFKALPLCQKSYIPEELQELQDGFSKNVQPVDILCVEEAAFTGDGIMNFHNIHVWTGENPPCCSAVEVSSVFS